MFILHYRSFDLCIHICFLTFFAVKNLLRAFLVKFSLACANWRKLCRSCRCLVIYFTFTQLHKNLKFTACLNQICLVRSTFLKFFIRFCVNEGFKLFSRQLAIYEQCCQVANFLGPRLARRHFSNFILSDSIFNSYCTSSSRR